jgi:hypothetical protein
LPRSNYSIAIDENEYQKKLPKTGHGERKPVTDYFRYVNREIIHPMLERTLISAIIPPNISHINTCLGISFYNYEDLLDFFCMTLSTVIDFRVKATGKGHVHTSLLKQLPMLKSDSPFRKLLHLRALSLVCLTRYYESLWNYLWDGLYLKDSWAKKDKRLPNSFFKMLTPTWQSNCALHNDFARRQALVEIDVLISMVIGLTLDELKTIYRIQFPVMKQYSEDTWYSANGRIAFTNSKGLSGIGFPRKASNTDPIGWDDIKGMESGIVERKIIDDTIPGGPIERTITYEAPFDRCDREKDYALAWAEFERRFGY